MAASLKTSVDVIQTTVNDLSTDLKDVKYQLSQLTDKMTKVRDNTSSLIQNKTLLTTKVDINAVRSSVIDTKNGTMNTISGEMDKLKNSLRENIKHDVLEVINNLRKRAPAAPSDEIAGNECIDALLTKTSVFPLNTRYMERMRKLYEHLYSMGGIISSVLEYLRFRSQVKILVDFDSESIGNMKRKVTVYDGQEKDGSSMTSYADLHDKVVYIAAEKASLSWLLPHLAQKLTQLAIGMVFENGGRPYVAGDGQSKSHLRAIAAEVERKQREGEELELALSSAVSQTGELAVEAYLIAAVPWVMAECGSLGGTNRLRKQIPALLEYYKDHVMAKLHQESKE